MSATAQLQMERGVCERAVSVSHEHFRSIEVAVEGEEVRVSADTDVLDEGNDYWVSMDVPESMLESLWA